MFWVGFYSVFAVLSHAFYGLSVFVLLMFGIITLGYSYEYIKKFTRRKLNDNDCRNGLLHNKNVIVTGGSSGIGKCVAILAARHGAHVTIVSRSVEKLKLARDEIVAACHNKNNQRIECLPLDVSSDFVRVERALDELQDRQGPCYMLVNCAGIAECGKIEDTTEVTMQHMVDLNLMGSYFCTKAVVPRMKQAKEGKVVLVSSQAGLLGRAVDLIRNPIAKYCESILMDDHQYLSGRMIKSITKIARLLENNCLNNSPVHFKLDIHWPKAADHFYQGIFGYSAYCCTKFGLRGLAESLAMELSPHNVSVTLSLPPDTDTPGFELEEQSKPLETKLISSTAALVQPELVAEQLLNDALDEKFFSIIGFESFILTTLCSGMSPYSSWCELLLQAMLMGPLKLISAFYLYSFRNIITRCMKERETHKKSE